MDYQLVKKMDTRNKIGKRIIGSLVPEEKRERLKQYLKDRPRAKMIRQESRAGKFHLEDMIQTSLQHISPVTAPLALISQPSFSGGTLLSRLLDGHSRLHAYPCAFAVDASDKVSWPQIDIQATPEEWLNVISKTIDIADTRKDIEKGEGDNAQFPFMYLPILQKQIFVKYLESIEPVNTRHIFDAHMTACFGAWLNYQNHRPDKKFVTAYAPGLIMQNEAINNFFEIYPDGRLISIIRNPEDWIACALTHKPEIYINARSAANRWKAGVRAVIETHKKFKNRVCLIRFEDLFNLTDAAMHYLSDFLDISFEDILLTPTFNSIPPQLSTSPEKEQMETASGYICDSQALNQNDRTLIKEMTQEDYQTISGKNIAI
jgi:hypothetical protein